MDDQLIQDILSQKTKSKKSVIYHRSLTRKDNKDTIISQSAKSMTKSKIDLKNGAEQNAYMDNDEIKSHKSQQAKVIQNTLNSLRRARLNEGINQAKLNANNLEKLSQKVEKNITIQPKNEKEAQLSIVQEEQKNEDAQGIRCVLCEAEQDQNELKLSQKLQWYSKERGETKKIINQLKLKLQQRQQAGDSVPIDPSALDASNPSQEIPLLCFKCQYEMILGNEGRHKAIKLFNIAQLELNNNPGSNKDKFKDPYLYPSKNLRMHQLSEEMKDLGIMKGTFYDYNTAEQQLEIKDPQINSRRFQVGDHSGKYRTNKSAVISIAREGAKSLQNGAIESNERKVRVWREDFADKIVNKFGSVPTEERQAKILKKLEKERMKYMIGQRIHNQNLQLMKEIQTSKSKNTSQLSKYKDNAYEEGEQNASTIVTSTSKNVNKSFNLKSSNEYFPSTVVDKKQRHHIDKTFFRKLSNFGAYANASFNGGVFYNPPSTFI